MQYANTKLANNTPFPLLDIKPGIWYHIHTAFFYLMLAWGIWLIVSKFKKSEGVLKRQNRIILIGAMIPWVVNLLYLLRIRPFHYIDLTPFAFIATSLVIGIGLLRFGLFDIMPVAREKIIEVLQEGILVADQQGRAIDLNPQMKKILGQQGRSYIGDTLDKLFTEVDLLNEADRTGQNHQLEISRKEAGQTRFYSVTITPLPERKTIHTGNVFLFRDITERKLNEQKLEELNQLKDRLFSIIAHDLRSPLISLADMLKLTEEGDLSNDEFISLLPELSKNIGYTFGLVENLLYWARSQLSGATVKPSLFDLHPVIEHLLGLFQHNADEKGIKIHNKIKGGVFVYADEDMIQVVLRNLVANAIKFCRKGDLIFINASCTANRITVSVEDTGIGISKENLSRLFALENFTTRGTVNEQGTGLGLMLCQEFIEKNNGTISVDSTLGQGSRFHFSLPHKQPETTLPA